VKQAILTNVNHIWICSWNQPILCNESSFLFKKTTGAFGVAQTHNCASKLRDTL